MRTPVRRRLIVTLTAAAIASTWAVPAMRALGTDRAVPVSSTRYVVRPGDTLWAIAERLSPGGDPRPLVDAIAGANGVDPGHLVPGQTLLVPGV